MWIKTVQHPLAECQAFLDFFLSKIFFILTFPMLPLLLKRTMLPFCQLVKESSQRNVPSKILLFHAKYFKFKKDKYGIESPNTRAVSCLVTVYHTLLLQGKEPEPRQTKRGWGRWRATTSTTVKWMNLPADREQCRETHPTLLPSLTLTSEQQQNPQTLRHLAFQSVKAGTLALNEIWVLITRH